MGTLKGVEGMEKPDLKLLPGGKDPGNDWLMALPINTVFLCQKKGDSKPILERCRLLYKRKKTVLLYAYNQKKPYIDVLSQQFSDMFEKIEELKEDE